MSAGAFWREVGVAVVLSIAGAIVHAACTPWLGTAASLRGIAILLSGSYLCWLLHAAHARSGRLLCLCAWLATVALLFALHAPLWLWLALPLALAWLVRSLYRYATLSGAAFDALLTALAFAAAIATARHSGSLLLSLWSLWLLQALHVFVPARNAVGATTGGDGFDRAHAVAEAALRRLAERR